MSAIAMRCAFALDDTFTLDSLGAQCDALGRQLDALAAGERGPLDVDASRVVRLDAAGLQLLIAFAHALEARGRTLRLCAPSAAMIAACHTTILAHAIGLVLDEHGDAR